MGGGREEREIRREDERRRLANEIAGEQNGEMNCGNGDANGGEGEEDGGDVAMLTG